MKSHDKSHHVTDYFVICEKKLGGLVRFLMVYYWAHHTMNDHKHPHNITIVPYYWVIFNGKHQHFMKHG